MGRIGNRDNICLFFFFNRHLSRPIRQFMKTFAKLFSSHTLKGQLLFWERASIWNF
jgi:hypothetical protein